MPRLTRVLPVITKWKAIPPSSSLATTSTARKNIMVGV